VIYLDITLIKRLIDEGIIDFEKLILRNYLDAGLSETEAFVIIELYRQMLKGNTYLSPAKIGKNLSLEKEDLLGILDNLIKRQYVTIELKKGKNGKETEVFLLDGTIQTIMANYQKEIKNEIIDKPKKYATNAEEIVDLLETEFKKQLTPLEIEIIQKWLDEDKFDIIDIKKAVLDSIKAGKSSLSYVDGILLRRRQKAKKAVETTYKAENSEALKQFYDSWDKK